MLKTECTGIWLLRVEMRQEGQRGKKTRWTQRGQRRTGQRLLPLFIPPTELRLGVSSCSLMPLHLLAQLKVLWVGGYLRVGSLG